jgi:methylmalonyl-CoA mutase cobalamin-binding subunit
MRLNFVGGMAAIALSATAAAAASTTQELVDQLSEKEAMCAKIAGGLAPEKKQKFCACFAGGMTALENVAHVAIYKPNSAEMTEAGKKAISLTLEMCIVRYK